MQLIKPIFALENKLQGAVFGLLGNVDKDEVKAELANLKDNSLVIYTYGLSPFSTEAIAMLEEEGVTFEKRELGLEWFLLGNHVYIHTYINICIYYTHIKNHSLLK